MVDRIDRAELVQLIEGGSVQVVDVLPEADYRNGHIPGAIHIPLKTLNDETTRVLDRAKPVAVY